MAAPNATTTTYLRVKRPRHVAPPSSLRVEGLSDDSNNNNKRARPNTVEQLACLLHQSTYIQQQQQHTASNNNTATTSSAVWKRVESTETTSQKRSIHYVDAVLDNLNDEKEEDGPRTKKRRLALTLVQDTKTNEPPQPPKPKKINVILDPRSRLVQERLQSVLSGDCTVAHYLNFISQDERLSDTPRVWLAWEDVRNSAGNILHAAALQNDVEGASAVLSWNVPSVVKAVDGNGQTPFQVAIAVGHDQVAQVLELTSCVENTAQQEDDKDYVYDVFCLDKDMKDDYEEEDEPTRVELRGGIGYWNEHGDLILEALEEMKEDSSQDNDDEEDSNCEDYPGNDYPEEEEAHFWDSDEEEEISFRHRPIYMSEGARVESRPTLVDEDEEYDAQYDLYEPSDPQRLYAYDAELDDSSESND